jgi:hypothetical protein
MVYAEDILEAILEFYERERAGAAEAKKIWVRSSATPIPGAGLVRPSYEQSPLLLTAAPSSHVNVRDIMDFCAHLMFKDYYCNGPRAGAGAGKYPEIYGILKKATGHAVLARGFGKRLERLRKKVIAEMSTRHNSWARDYYDAFLLGIADLQVGVRSTPAAWAVAVEGARAKYGVVVAVPAAPISLPVEEPAEIKVEAPAADVPEPAPAPTPAPSKPLTDFVEATEADAQAAVAAIKAAEPGWFSGLFKGWW